MNISTTTEQISFEDLLTAIQPVEGGREIKDPATGALVGRAPEHTTADLHAAIAAARTAQPGWGALTHTERSAYLNLAADAVEANAETLAVLLSREQGKPLNGPNARFEVGACAAWLRTDLSHEGNSSRARRRTGRRSRPRASGSCRA